MSVRLRALDERDDAALGVLFADPACGLWNPGPADGDVAAWRARGSEPADDFRTWAVVEGPVADGETSAADDALTTFSRCGFALDAVLPAHHVYGDGIVHDEHRHVRVL